ncbi:hypothetical protein TSOC_006372 [Tetrabaena socialis]|uniref:Uncharacterized protein n=1 Tax=Tetrabaena socialis TaxID=47790 RepID=A0A2J8A3V5_9CHLO|nr:hypothetical protein TSOC_006372 [Tetrabaena socialis]|eukprot:PNH07199.1 hypothetical protein TSOC_006372 [Tetrabaena socialis]
MKELIRQRLHSSIRDSGPASRPKSEGLVMRRGYPSAPGSRPGGGNPAYTMGPCGDVTRSGQSFGSMSRHGLVEDSDGYVRSKLASYDSWMMSKED